MIRNIRFSAGAAGVMSSTTPVEQAASAQVIEPRASEAIFSVHTAIGGANVITVEVSNDGAVWVPFAGVAAGAGGANATTITANGITVYNVQTRFFRLNVTTYASGTVVAEVSLGQR
jgi:hypothetical protein